MENKENNFIKKGNLCFSNIIKSYEEMLKFIAKDVSNSGYPSMSNLKVQSEIVKIIQSFEQIEIIMNESMEKSICCEESGKEQKLQSYHTQLKASKDTITSFMNDLENLKNEGEILLSKCERKCVIN